MEKFKELTKDIEILVKPAWGSNGRLICLPKNGDSNGAKWKWNGSTTSPSIEGSILVPYKNCKIHFWIREGKIINAGDGVDVELLEFKVLDK